MWPNLFEEPSLLDYIAHRLHLHSLYFVDILECVGCPSLFVLDHSDLAPSWVRTSCRGGGGTDLPECAFADDLEQPEVEESDLAVKVDGLRTTANGPHGGGEGRGFGTATVDRGDHQPSVSEAIQGLRPQPFLFLALSQFLESIRTSLPYVFPPPTTRQGMRPRTARHADHGLLNLTRSHIRRLLLVSAFASTVSFLLIAFDSSGMYGRTSNFSGRPRK